MQQNFMPFIGGMTGNCCAGNPMAVDSERRGGSKVRVHWPVARTDVFAVAGKTGIIEMNSNKVWMSMKLDRIDLRILSELQKNGRITNVELAELVNLSPSPCLMRVKKLQAEGYITSYSAQIDVSKLGQTLTVFTEITLKNHRQADFARFLATIARIESVIECHLVSGGYDYL